jgi:hypothetical protein
VKSTSPIHWLGSSPPPVRTLFDGYAVLDGKRIDRVTRRSAPASEPIRAAMRQNWLGAKGGSRGYESSKDSRCNKGSPLRFSSRGAAFAGCVLEYGHERSFWCARGGRWFSPGDAHSSTWRNQAGGEIQIVFSPGGKKWTLRNSSPWGYLHGSGSPSALVAGWILMWWREDLSAHHQRRCPYDRDMRFSIAVSAAMRSCP